MMLFTGVLEAQEILAKNIKSIRLLKGLTQSGLATRSGVPLPTLRKFERQGLISLESFLKIIFVLGILEDFVKASESRPNKYNSIEEVLKEDKVNIRKRGWRK